MAELRAFVGHSFTENDEVVIAAFLKLFDRISKLNTSFSWAHAEAAEPKQLSEKVLSWVEDCNLFIGICTKKEAVVASNIVFEVPLLKSLYFLSRTKLEWKTSDWIIQEIGMAIGRGLAVILLIEDGVRRPGGLQGDIEFISFARESPEKSYGKIIEMITSLGAQGGGPVSLPSQTAGREAEEIKTEPLDDESWKSPSKDWDIEKFEQSIFIALIERDAGLVAKINDVFLALSTTSAQERLSWKARVEYFKIMLNQGGDLEAIQSLVADNPNDGNLHVWYARALRTLGRSGDSAAEFMRASDNADKVDERISLLGDAAREYELDKKSEKSALARERMRTLFKQDGRDEAEFLRALLPTKDKRDDFDLATLERIIALKPSNNRERFDLAYAYSQNECEDIALYHYEKIPFDNRTGLVWNNLGAALDHFQAPVQAVKAWKKAEQKDETLAMANLGYKLASVGFASEAEALGKKAMMFDGYHKNVAHLLVQIKDAPEEEENKTRDVLSRASVKRDFYEKLGRAIGGTAIDLSGEWHGPECKMILQYSLSGQVVLAGEYERDANSLSLLVLGSASPTKVRQRISYSGTIRGRAIIGELSKNDNVTTRSLLDTISTKVMMHVDDNLNQIHVVERPSSANPTYYSLSRHVRLEASAAVLIQG